MNSRRTVSLKQVVATWREASRQLGIEVTSPFTLRAGRKAAECVAFVPHFGGSLGMVVGVTVPPDFETDAALIECARATGLFFSFVNAERYTAFDAAAFKEALSDWGFFGAPSARPRWLSKATRKSGQ